MKFEPDVWSIDQQKKAGSKGAPWDGVRNYQAAKNLKSMKKGDLCFSLSLNFIPRRRRDSNPRIIFRRSVI